MNTGLHRITDRVWWWPHHPDPDRVQSGIGIVTGSEGSLIVDAGHSPALASLVIDAVSRRGLPPASVLVYTHHHWDHVWGASEWEVPVIAHELAVLALRVEAQKPWSEEYLKSEMLRDPLLRPSYSGRLRAVDDWSALQIVLPTQSFSHEHTINFGDVGVELTHVGGNHSSDSTVVAVPGDSVLFLGDCYYPPPYHLRGPDDELDLEMAADLLDLDYEWYLEAHDEPRRREEIILPE